jgi:hypothetical protein
MVSAANNQGFGAWNNANWNAGPGHFRGPWGHHYWGAMPPWMSPHAMKGLLVAATILGFVFWWPLGLGLLAFLVFSKRACGWGRYGHWQGRGPDGGRGSWGGGWQRWAAPQSSGNRAFDEYRAATLRRLEEEQKEFAEFLDRLRFAKDKAEFDQFMAERRNRETEPPSAPEPPASN